MRDHPCTSYLLPFVREMNALPSTRINFGTFARNIMLKIITLLMFWESIRSFWELRTKWCHCIIEYKPKRVKGPVMTPLMVL